MEISYQYGAGDKYTAKLILFPREVLEDTLQDLIEYVEDHDDRNFAGLEPVRDEVCLSFRLVT